MAVQFHLTIDSKKLQEAMNVSPAKVFKAMELALREGVREVSNDVIQNRATGGTTATRLAVRTGDLWRRIMSWTEGDNLNTLTGHVGVLAGTKPPYARVHEYGTVGAGGTLPDIRPKKAQWLAIPLPAAKTSAGVSRGGPRSGAYGETFVKKGIIFGKVGKNQIQPLFVLKKRVAIPPRLGIRETMKAHIPDLVERLNKAIASLL